MQPVEILLVEDNEADVDLIKESLTTTKVMVNLRVAMDGQEALETLRNTANRKPDLILLDLNLPKIDGRGVLDEIKKNSSLRTIPVVILTSSEAEIDIVKSYELGANCYIKKPVDFTQFQRIVESIEDFWFSVVRLPPT